MKRDDYPIQWVQPNGRRSIGVDTNDKPATEYERVTGWVCHPADKPNHKKPKRGR